MSNSAERPSLTRQERLALQPVKERASRLLDTTDYPANVAYLLYSLRWFSPAKLRLSLALAVTFAPACMTMPSPEIPEIGSTQLPPIITQIQTETIDGFKKIEAGQLPPRPNR